MTERGLRRAPNIWVKRSFHRRATSYVVERARARAQNAAREPVEGRKKAINTCISSVRLSAARPVPLEHSAQLATPSAFRQTPGAPVVVCVCGGAAAAGVCGVLSA
jgi:hypothetical protein